VKCSHPALETNKTDLTETTWNTDSVLQKVMGVGLINQWDASYGSHDDRQMAVSYQCGCYEWADSGFT